MFFWNPKDFWILILYWEDEKKQCSNITCLQHDFVILIHEFYRTDEYIIFDNYCIYAGCFLLNRFWWYYLYVNFVGLAFHKLKSKGIKKNWKFLCIIIIYNTIFDDLKKIYKSCEKSPIMIAPLIEIHIFNEIWQMINLTTFCLMWDW